MMVSRFDIAGITRGNSLDDCDGSISELFTVSSIKVSLVFLSESVSLSAGGVGVRDVMCLRILSPLYK